ncbi:MAG: hypothetical protein AAB885_02520 [Patescibacteria group bacterium]
MPINDWKTADTPITAKIVFIFKTPLRINWPIANATKSNNANRIKL